ncbi:MULTISPECIES: hypothetical protein [Rhizobium]|uniref:Uncharacterized protein n=1 Tax=Rhizobium rhododendri TaxID=2506430 RepID=A0ABY8IN97_9HYPH|nr:MULTISPECIES: hypothetical protein [Rhizobium]MBO9100794.1 hypothetical protein [Rhizobium sp. L58/93]QXZ87350.1 hypothetical protein J5287_22690 [Rhizobium sp. K1/93]QXZ92618.1 hypothetical protein J5280_26500 [Rhizobium sp. K15/93]QYA04162.1 hypothetical protein J5278_25855 [Rhizobium sp. B21/90]TQX86763.1 hypothetical protein EQW76_16495 [Rhizobium sp. rho-13.1]
MIDQDSGTAKRRGVGIQTKTIAIYTVNGVLHVDVKFGSFTPQFVVAADDRAFNGEPANNLTQLADSVCNAHNEK